MSTAATLPADGEVMSEIPELPATNRRRRWHIQTLAWWTSIWQSPMATEFLESDVHGLVMLAELWDAFWKMPAKETRKRAALAQEIRMQGQRFGLSPIDRRRLQWEVERAETAGRHRQPPPRTKRVKDPRQLLRVV